MRGVIGGGGSRPTLRAEFNTVRLWARRSGRALRPREKRRLVESAMSGRGSLGGVHGAGGPSHGVGIFQQAKVNGGLRIESRRRRRGT